MRYVLVVERLETPSAALPKLVAAAPLPLFATPPQSAQEISAP
jgi:hypothetical protein